LIVIIIKSNPQHTYQQFSRLRKIMLGFHPSNHPLCARHD